MNTNELQRPYIVGLTGGIGSGKSIVTEMFRKLDAEVIDADEISRTLVKAGSPALKHLVEHFGTHLLNVDESLQRPLLRNLIFSDPAAKAWIEQLLHPLIHAAIVEQILHSHSRWLLLSVPLLLESNRYDFVDRIVVVDIPEELQLERTHQRDKTDVAQIKRIIASQLPREARLLKATEIINNTGDLNQLQAQVVALHMRYQELANDRHKTN